MYIENEQGGQQLKCGAYDEIASAGSQELRLRSG